MLLLHELLATESDELMRRWSDKVLGTLLPASMPRAELADALPAFIQEIVGALRADEVPENSRIAAEHGAQRLRLGFDLGSVVREFGELRNCIVALASERGVSLSTFELQVLFDCVVAGIAASVSEYGLQRDAELQRQATEHVAFIAHELRNPLHSSRMALSLLKSRGELPAGRAHDALGRGLARMHELIEHSLALARFGSNVEARLQPVRLSDIVDDIAAEAGADAEQRQVRLIVNVQAGAEIFADPRLLRSAASNLVRNAVKFTHAGGTVEVRGHVAGERATIEVEDACGGLPPGMVEKAFAPFVQLDPSRGGFGLGLAIAKQAAEAHRGSIRVQNLPGKGCIFVLDLPAGRPA